MKTLIYIVTIDWKNLWIATDAIRTIEFVKDNTIGTWCQWPISPHGSRGGKGYYALTLVDGTVHFVGEFNLSSLIGKAEGMIR